MESHSSLSSSGHPKKGVLVFHPSRTLNTYQACLAFQEAGLLRSFETGFYSKQSRFLKFGLSLFPSSFKSTIERELRRRIQPGLRDEYIHTHVFWDMLFTYVARWSGSRRWTEKSMYWRNHRLGLTVARVIDQERPSAVYCYETTAVEAFQACTKVGSLKILEHISGHYETYRHTAEEEIKLHSEFAEDLRLGDSEKGRQQWIQESKMADAIVVPSAFVAKTLIDIGISQDRMTIIPYGVDTERFHPRSEARTSGPFRILYAGRIHPMKGVIYLLEAFKQLKLANVELIFVGSGDFSAKGWLPYRGIFRHIPRVPYEEMPDYYRNADLFIFPSLHEGSALVTYEAMASGLPVITTENAGSVIRNGEDGWIVPIRDVDVLKQKMSLMMADRELRESISAKARARAEQFSWTAYRQNLIQGLHKLI
jgi:alpha-maltose-1-phosphate synthase